MFALFDKFAHQMPVRLQSLEGRGFPMGCHRILLVAVPLYHSWQSPLHDLWLVIWHSVLVVVIRHMEVSLTIISTLNGAGPSRHPLQYCVNLHTAVVEQADVLTPNL